MAFIIRKIPDWIFYLIPLGILLLIAFSSHSEFNQPPPLPERGPALPNVRPGDTQVLVRIREKPHSGVGTAFAIDDKGNWLTARHVVDKCDQIGLRLDKNYYVKVDLIKLSKDRDTALLKSKWSRPPVARDFVSRRQVGEPGYFIGYPKGEPGEVAGKLLGRRRLVIRGRYQTREPILAWTETGRTLGLKGSLGGLSGGPAFDSAGKVIGLVTAESPRRGRVYTLAPSSLARIAPKSGKKPKSLPMTATNYGRQADKLRRVRSVAKVVCLVNGY